MLKNIFTDCCLTKLICVHQAHKKLIFFLCENGGKTATFLPPLRFFTILFQILSKRYCFVNLCIKQNFFNIIDDLCSSGASCALVDLRGGKMFLGIFREFVKKSSELCKFLPKFPRNASK